MGTNCEIVKFKLLETRAFKGTCTGKYNKKKSCTDWGNPTKINKFLSDQSL